MKKWQKAARQFLVFVLLASNLTSLAPIAQGATTVADSSSKVTETTDATTETITGDGTKQKEEAVDTTGETTVGTTVTESSTTVEKEVDKTQSSDLGVETTKDSEKTEEKPEKKAVKKGETVPVQLLGINDFHGAIDTTGTAYLPTGNVSKAGRAANLSTHMNVAETTFKQAKPNGTSIRVQTGDMVGASPANSALLQDEPTIKILNRLKIKYGTLGNHEFDEGLSEFSRILNGVDPKPGEFNSITENYSREKSNMDILIANVVNRNGGGQPENFKPYAVETIGEGDKEVKVGFIGVITTEFPNLVLKKHHENYNVLDEADTIVKYSKELRKDGVQAIVVLGHIAATSSGEAVSGEAATVMAKVNSLDPDNSVDAFFAGHNHQHTNGLMGTQEKGTRVVQSTSQGKAYIDLQGEIDVETKDFVETPKASVKAVTDTTKDTEIVAIVDDANKLVKTVTTEKIGTAAVASNILRTVNNSSDNESPLGNLITDAQLYMAKQSDLKDDSGKPIKIDFALTNNGGIREDLKVQENADITWGAAQGVQPFGNILQVVAISGANLKAALNEQFGGKYFLQIAGLSYTYDMNGGVPARVRSVKDSEGNELKNDQTYHIVINDFLLGGGDGFKSFTKGKLVTAMDTDTDTFINYFKLMEKEGKKITAPELGRKTKAEASNVVPIQFLGLNDYHGALDTTGTAYLPDGKFEKVGRAANLAAHLNEAEANFKMATASGQTERVQSGDLVGASPANSALLQDEPTIKVFNRMDFGIGTIGNHEFDEGLGEFKRILDGIAPIPGKFNPIVDNYAREKSSMTVLLANVINKNTGEHGAKGEIPYGFEPYTIKEYGKVKVGYIGIITSEFTNLVLKQHHENFEVLDEATTIAKYSKELRDQGVNAIVLVSHLAATSNAKEEVQGEVADVMAKVETLDPDNSIDLVFAGHNHQYANGVIKGKDRDIRVVQSTSQGKAYIDVQGEIDVTTKDFVETPKAEVKPTTDRADKDARIVEIVAEASKIVKQVTDKKVGTADEATQAAGMISRDYGAIFESPLGNLITDAQLYMANQSDLKDENGKVVKADFALTNNGGIRGDLIVDTETGDITWGAAQFVQPFGNILQLVEISGKDLLGALNQQHPKGKEHYFLQISGLTYTYTRDESGFKVVKVKDSKGKAITETDTYTIVINDFLLGGGDGFSSFTKGKLITAMDTDTDTFIDYFKLMEKEGTKIATPKVERKTEDVASNVVPIQFLGLNDYHGALDTTGTAYINGVATRDAGKAANLAAHLNEAENNFKTATVGGQTERVQSGDLVGASPANSALLQDEPTIKVFNRMDFGIGTIGNHEFDEGLGEFKRILDGIAPIPGKFNPIVDNYAREKSSMTVLLANVINKNTGEHGAKGEIPYGFEPYTIKEYGKVKVGYIGIITSEFTNLVLKQHHENFEVLDEATTIAKYSKELRDQGVNAIVLVSHLAATSNAKEEVQGEVADVMAKVEKIDPDNSIDLVFAGHNHQYANGVIKGKDRDIRVVQSTSQGKAYIDVQGEIDVTTKDFIETPKAEVKPTTDRADKDAGIVEIVAEASKIVKQVTDKKVGTADKETQAAGMITRDYGAIFESPLGNLITDAQLYMANQSDLKDENGKVVKADFALTNNGGIRGDLIVDTETGDITWGAAQFVQPFGNILQLVEISGKDLLGALNQQHPKGKEHYFLQISGLTYTYTRDESGFKVVKVKDSKGKAITETDTYTIVINDFLLGGGDGFSSFTKGKLITAMDTDTDTFIDYFKLMEKEGTKIATPKVERKTEDVASNVVPIQFLGLNDYHGALDTTGTAYINGVATRDAGKAANLAAHLNEAENNFKTATVGGQTERVQSGDLVGASPANSALLQDEPTIKVFNRMDFGIGTIGNHEFDEGLGEFKRILDGIAPIPGKFNPIVDNYAREKSSMTVLLANVINKNTGEHGAKGEIPYGFEPYTIKEYGKVKVGYIGIITSEFTNLVLKQHHENFEVLDEATTIAKYSKELRDQGVNAIVLVSHLAATSNAKEEVQGEVADVMAKVETLDPDNSIDLVFAGHNHQYANGVIKGKDRDIRVVQSTSQGKAYIDVQGEIDVTTKDFVETPKAEVKPTTDRADKDARIVEIVAEASKIVKQVTDKKVGTADEATQAAGMISRDYGAIFESPLGNLITDAQLYMANQSDLKDENGKVVKADFALTNNGGIRGDLIVDTETGDITWGAAQFVQPFGNILQLVEISGKDLLGALNQQHPKGKEHYFLQISGLTYTYTRDESGFKVVKVKDSKGKAITETDTYTIVINDFLLGGGDGFSSFTKGKLITAMDTDTDTFIDYFKLMEKEGTKIATPKVERKTEDDGIEKPDPEEVTKEKLEKATVDPKIKAGDKKIEGTTLPKTKVSYSVATAKVKLFAKKAAKSTTVEADASGKYILPVSETLKEDDAVTLTFTNGDVVISRVLKVVAKDPVTKPITKEELEAGTKTPTTLPVNSPEIVGESLEGTTVSYLLNGKEVPNHSPMTVTETGSFLLPIVSPLTVGDVITLNFENGAIMISRTVEVVATSVPPTDIQKLQEASSVSDLFAGDKKITGKSIPGATVSYRIKDVEAKTKVSPTITDAKGVFLIDLLTTPLKEKQVVIVTFVYDGTLIEIEKKVGPKKAGNGQTGGTSDKQKDLPKTGEVESLISAVGISIILGSCLIFIYDKRKKENILS